MLMVMMTISEMERMARTTDASWRSPVADVVASRWGYPPGKARWWRSSSTHVFVLPADDGDRASERFLRFVPDLHGNGAEVWAVARLTMAVAASGPAVATVEPSLRGGLVESVDTDLGLMHAMVVRRAPGDQLDADDLTVTQARAWGRALGQLHDAAAGSADRLPDMYCNLRRDGEIIVDDPDLSRSIGRIADALDALPRDPAWFGVGHGDFELDNMAWADDVPTAFDFDDAGMTWFIGDIADAVRDLTSMGRPFEAHHARFDAFVAGYREHHVLPPEQLDLLPLFAAAGTADRLLGLRRALVVDPRVGAEMDSLVALRVRLTEVAERDRQDLLRASMRHGRGGSDSQNGRW